MMNMQINLTEARKSAELVSLIGRNGKLSCVVLDKRNLSKPKYHATMTFDGNFNTAMMMAATKVINDAVGKNAHIIMLTTNNNVVGYRTYRKYAKLGMDADAIIDKMTSTSYYQPQEGDDEFVIQTKEDSISALAAFVQALYGADACGIYVELKAASEFNQIILNVPEGVELEAEQILTFKDGKTEEGITAVGWPSFNRAKAKVYTKFSNGRQEFFLYQKSQERMTNIEKAQRNVLTKQWQECPAAEVDVDLSEETADVAMFG